MSPPVIKDELRAQWTGKTLHDVPTPSVVLDLAKLEANCDRMLQVVRRLSLSWRAHIKTHKTIELTRLQVGDELSSPANIVVSTVLEAENVAPLLKEYQARGRQVNVLYGFPLYPTAVDRLAKLSAYLGPSALSLMIDHPEQLPSVEAIRAKSGIPPLVYMKVDMGYKRAGVIPSTAECETLIDAITAAAGAGSCLFHGIYAHAGHSYQAREDWQALDYLAAEFKALEAVSSSIRKRRPSDPLVLSVGATPTATCLQHPSLDGKGGPGAGEAAGPTLVNEYISSLKDAGFELEIHAGVYPALDLQQLATHACDGTILSSSSIAITVLCEIASLYPGRGPNGTTEVLINAGCLALGREPCADMGPPGEAKHYSGWGIVAPWGIDNPVPGPDFPAVHGGWQVGKVSQEHGILRWVGDGKEKVALGYGQKVRIWPNHACVAGAGYEHYFVVDSRRSGREDDIVDVWPRWRGW